MRIHKTALLFAWLTLTLVLPAGAVTIPDGRALTPVGFTIPVDSFISDQVLSPDGNWLAVVGEGASAVDIISTHNSRLNARLPIPGATGAAWTSDGLYVTRGYSGLVSRFTYAGPKLQLTSRPDLDTGIRGLVNGVAEDPATHRLAVACTAVRTVEVFDDATGARLNSLATSGQPYRVGMSGGTLLTTLYDSDHVEAWRLAAPGEAHDIPTGAHPTALLVDGDRFFVANADGHDVVLVDSSLTVRRRFDLSDVAGDLPGQTPAGMALSSDGAQLYVAESGMNDVAVIDVASGRVLTRIPTAWYPTAVSYLGRATVAAKDPRVRAQLWVADAKGLGSQPDTAGEWDGTYTGLVQHFIVEPAQFKAWSRAVALNNRLAHTTAAVAFPPIKHVVFIVHENKHFDESFGDEPDANADPALVLYGRHFTPNAHALAERYTLFDNFMGNGEASIYGHSWSTQGMVNDYQERNAHLDSAPKGDPVTLVASQIWPWPLINGTSIPSAAMDFDWFHDLADLGKVSRVNVSGVFGPRGELIDALQRRGVPYRVYGEQMTMMPDGRIAPGLAAHADRAYPGDHINFGISDTVRAQRFLDDVKSHGLAAYSYVTLPTDHTAGTKAGYYKPESFIASNDRALGLIIAGLSARRDWKNTIVFVTTDDPQGTGDHVDAHRQPALIIGPYIRRRFVDHTRYSFPSFLRTVELIFGVQPLNIEDALAPPMTDVFAKQPTLEAYHALRQEVPMEMNPGPRRSDMSYEIDGPDSNAIPSQEWVSIKGVDAYERHVAYLRSIDAVGTVALH